MFVLYRNNCGISVPAVWQWLHWNWHNREKRFLRENYLLSTCVCPKQSGN